MKTPYQYCFMGGFPRAGTRQFADILNKSNLFHLKGEVYNRSFRRLKDLLEQGDMDHKGRWSEESYFKYRTISAFQMGAAISKGSNASFSVTNAQQIIGFKSPRIERHKGILDTMVAYESKPILFYYCVRNIQENFLSLKSTFGVTVEDFVKDTIESLEMYFVLLQDEKYDVKLLNLDGFIKDENKGNWIKNNIFSNVISQLDDDECEGMLKKTTNRNATVAHGKKRLTELSDEEVYYITKNKRLVKICKDFSNETGIDLF